MRWSRGEDLHHAYSIRPSVRSGDSDVLHGIVLHPVIPYIPVPWDMVYYVIQYITTYYIIQPNGTCGSTEWGS